MMDKDKEFKFAAERVKPEFMRHLEEKHELTLLVMDHLVKIIAVFHKMGPDLQIIIRLLDTIKKTVGESELDSIETLDSVEADTALHVFANLLTPVILERVFFSEDMETMRELLRIMNPAVVTEAYRETSLDTQVELLESLLVVVGENNHLRSVLADWIKDNEH